MVFGSLCIKLNITIRHLWLEGGGGDLANLKARGHRVYEGVWAESAQPNTGEKLSANRNRALQKNLFISVFVSYSYA